MKLSINFSEDEITAFLKKEGYSIIDYAYTYWHQLGNHDGYGEVRESQIKCAVKEDQSPDESLGYRLVFERLIEEKIKSKLLS